MEMINYLSLPSSHRNIIIKYKHTEHIIYTYLSLIIHSLCLSLHSAYTYILSLFTPKMSTQIINLTPVRRLSFTIAMSPLFRSPMKQPSNKALLINHEFTPLRFNLNDLLKTPMPNNAPSKSVTYINNVINFTPIKFDTTIVDDLTINDIEILNDTLLMPTIELPLNEVPVFTTYREVEVNKNVTDESFAPHLQSCHMCKKKQSGVFYYHCQNTNPPTECNYMKKCSYKYCHKCIVKVNAKHTDCSMNDLGVNNWHCPRCTGHCLCARCTGTSTASKNKRTHDEIIDLSNTAMKSDSDINFATSALLSTSSEYDGEVQFLDSVVTKRRRV